MKKLTTVHYFIFFTVIVVGVLIAVRVLNETQPSKYDDLAQCIADSGATFYGAFWCPHCAEQKKEFGKSAKLLPYVECSNPDKQSQTQVCIDAGIKSYPTWELKGGTRLPGVQTPQQLAKATDCALP